jgi:type II secretory pathway component PulF
VSIEINPYEVPPVLIPVEPQPPPRPGGLRLRHLMYAVLYIAIFCWLGVLAGALLFSLGFAMLVAIVVGVVLIYSRRRSTQQEALLWALATAAGREIPLAPTLEAFASQSRGRYRRKVLFVAQSLREGRSLTEVLDREPGLFPRDVKVLICVGSESGALAGALREAFAMRSATQRPWLAVGIRIVYLCWVTFILQGVVSFISYFILPKFEAIFADFGVPLPSVTIVWIEITHFFIVYWPILLLLMLIELGLLMLGSVSILGIPPWHLPLIDRLFIRRHSALIFRCVARLVEEKRPLAQGFASLARTYPTRWIRKRLEQVAREVNGGDDWSESLARHGLIRPAEAALLESARRVGNLPWALREAAESSERRLAYRFQFWLLWISPLLVLTLGAIVLMVAVAYFAPVVMLIQRLTP